MSESLPLLALAVMFVVATLFPINIGILAFVGAFFVGTASLHLSEDEILESFPASLFVTILGVTYLFAVAQRNGTVDLLVRGGVKLVRGKVALIPWVLFAVCGLLSALGTFPTAAIALLAPVGLKFAQRHGMSQLLIGAVLVAGAHAGSFSPIAVSGAIVLGMIEQTPLQLAPHALFLASLAFNVLIAAVSFVVLRGHRRADPAAAVEQEADDDASAGVDWRQVLTLAMLVVLVGVALVFRLEIGFLALGAGALLALVDLNRQSKAIEGVSWSTIVLIGGMITYVGILEEAGTIDAISHGASQLGSPLLVALLLCVVVAVVSAFASSTAILTAIIPIAVPLLLSSDLSAAGLVAALAVSATIVDTSPFSSNGALVLSNARGSDRTMIYRQLLGYTGAVVAVGPLFAWGLLVLPGAL
ncbi:C4-dicarboxylate ABC transporter [Saccharopolyspora sp. HNM0986]|uniref:SLC13 family permease n=1 Tax=Saccharopolyspora galaxeae TaxID=2781241 RepID=UPI00190B69BB|nr:SLC13 family permease [Saccharopolyspora sp. HNM0986]MBK0866574.1 C4-dicarboxylate ABC transporter [Saccharopolyspora sp. HNM0986]